MEANNSGEQARQPRRSFGQYAKQGGLAVLFGTILMIPRIRRLRRRVWAWTWVRLFAGAGGVWLAWRYARTREGAATLVLTLVLLALSLLARAKPAMKPVDTLAAELNALIVLNGGIFRPSADFAPIARTQIFVCPDRIVVLGPRERRLLEVPLAKVRKLAAHPSSNGTGKEADPWEVEIQWVADGLCTATLLYDGPFAEHLARVSEATLRGQWRKELPVIPPDRY